MPVVYENRFDTIAKELKPRVDLAVRRTAAHIVHDAKRNLEGARYSRGTERLKDHFHIERKGMAEYEVRAGDDQAWYGHLVEFGTNPHAIPNAFGLGITVQHPGASPHPFLVPAAELNRKTLDDEVGKALRDL